MKTISKLFLLVIIILSLSACNGEKGTKDSKLSEMLSQLKIGMTTQEVIDILGEPTKDIGSGTYIYVYDFDGENISLLFDGKNQLLGGSIKSDDNNEESIF